MIYMEASQEELTIKEYQSRLIEAVMKRACSELDKDFDVNLFFVSDEEIQAVNLEQRNIDRATDVLSFPMCDIPGGEYELDPETGNIVLGDILVSLEHCAKQADEYGHAFTRELCFLVAHGMLHLLGYDHMEEDEEKIMLSKQDEILEELEITREKTEEDYEL